MRRDPDRLDEDDDVLVVVHDLHALDRLGHDLHGLRLPGHLDLQPGTALHPVRLAGLLPVEQHFPPGGQLRGLRTGETEHPGKRSIDALTFKAIRNGQGAGLRKRAHLIEYAGRPSGGLNPRFTRPARPGVHRPRHRPTV
ncbi:hypothetical protein SCA03_67840 [Streptomyces cacaoi]|uniref:Uncharacterized protein n=1 Tax=Streptomyces cacaoi TaxID=1898 RepID=A0A4Y3RC23_STRCI|nr:hypothetical protein SCA03_67840 [Streptomyces cacaoi]